MLKLVIQAFFGEDKIESPAIHAAIGDFNFLYFSGVLFLIYVLTIVIASGTSVAPEPDRIRGLTFSPLDRAPVRATIEWKDYAATALVLGVVIGLYLYFSFWI